MPDDAILRMEGISKNYVQGHVRLHILENADLTIKAGETVGLVGPSGSGKSTLLHLAGLLDQPDKGHVWIAGEEASRANDNHRTQLRSQTLGFVYQFHHLLPEFSALDNVSIPLINSGESISEARGEAASMLEQMGLGSRIRHRPPELSGGEQQRVAIARAIVTRPRLLLMDEPTGNLDPATAESVFSLLMEMVKKQNMACLMVTHNLPLARALERVVTLENGRIVPFSA